jgi:hypothetical protein
MNLAPDVGCSKDAPAPLSRSTFQIKGLDSLLSEGFINITTDFRVVKLLRVAPA